MISSALHPEPTNSKPGAVHAITQPFGHEGFFQALIKLYDIKKSWTNDAIPFDNFEHWLNTSHNIALESWPKTRKAYFKKRWNFRKILSKF